MKQILATTAVAALAIGIAAPAHAQLQLGVAGHFKGYVSWDNQDTNTGVNSTVAPGTNNMSNASAGSRERNFDILRDTEVHFTGETTLDNGLTVGVHVEALADDGDSFGVDESYAYFSGMWGRANFGDEDGAAYLLQVAAPSADSNVDGIRQYVNPVNYNLTDLHGIMGAAHLGNDAGGGTLNGFTNLPLGSGELDYANDATRHSDKLTYLTPVFSGFQAGVSYTPQVGYGGAGSRSFGNSIANGTSSAGLAQDDIWGSAWEGAARWEGNLNNIGINAGGGYTWVNLQDRTTFVNNAGTTMGFNNFKQWNLGADVNYSAFGLGVIYTQNNEGVTNGFHEKTWDVGADYTTGPFKLGLSWLNDKMEGAAGFVQNNATIGDVKTNRYSGGVIYTFAPGMSFRGSLGYVKSTVDSDPDVSATYGLLGTQINF